MFAAHAFFTDGKHLNTTGFELVRYLPITVSRSRDRVTATPSGPEHTLFTIEGVKKGILVETGSRLNEQKELLELIAQYPFSCFVEEVDKGLCGKYCPIEEYAQLLNSEDIYTCRFALKNAADVSDERDIDLLESWMGTLGTSEVFWYCRSELLCYCRLALLWFCKLVLRFWIEYKGVYSPVESSTLVQRHLYIKYSWWGFAWKLSWCPRAPSDGVLMF